MTAPTAFMQIARAVADVFKAEPAVSPNVFRSRSRVVARQMDTAIVVYQGRAQRTEADGTLVPGVWDTQLVVEHYAREVQGATVEDALDALLQSAHDRLAEDPTLNDLVADCELASLNWDYDMDGEQTACATAVYVVQHATDHGSLT